MKRLLIIAMLLLGVTGLSAQEFEHNFADQTLRIDYTFMGNANEQFIGLHDLSVSNNWWGRRINLTTVPLAGNGDLTLYDATTGEAIYKTSFSSLFQEWLTTVYNPHAYA